MMNKKKVLLVLGVIIALLNIAIIMFFNTSGDDEIIFSTNVKSEMAGAYQLFYSTDGVFSEGNSIIIDYTEVNQENPLEFMIPIDTKFIRFDFPNAESNILISNLKFIYNKKEKLVDQELLSNLYGKNSITQYVLTDNHIDVTTGADDPQIVIDVNNIKLSDFASEIHQRSIILIKIIYCSILTLAYLIVLLLYDKLFYITKEVYKSRKIIYKLALNDFKTKYVGSYLGIIWAFIQPIITILVYWFVFEVGFRTQKVGDFPYVLWLTTGIITWFYFSEAWLGATNSLLEYSYLVKKVVFRISILPIVKIISALFVHIFFIVFTFILFAINGYTPDIYVIQIIYYAFCLIALLLGLSYITSAIIIFFRDLSQIISILLQIGMWMTPILWNPTMIAEKYQWILKLNPLYYVVNGYRDSLINKVWFWQSPNWTVYFWCSVGILFVLGTIIFRKLKPHFADVL